MKRVAILLLACSGAASAAVDFEREVRPIIETSCLGCHNAEKALGGLRMDSSAGLGATVVAGKPEASMLWQVLEIPPHTRGAMPPGSPLPKAQRDVIRRWIAEGALWPAGVTLGSASAKRRDDRALAEGLYRRIADNAATQATDRRAMRAYKTAIPGTAVSFEMVPIPGSAGVEPFWMGKYEVTWDEYRLFMFARQAGETQHQDELVDAVSRPTRPYVEMSFGMGIEGYPAISMTQHAANKYAEWLSARTGQFYRLPTEAEWEYACRAGASAGAVDPTQLGEYAWFAGNSEGKYQKVGTRKPNAWGLFDMTGNVMEWTLERYALGGSWNDLAEQVTCGARVPYDPAWKMQDPQLPKSIWYLTDAQWLGFRLIRPLKVPAADQMFGSWNSGAGKD